MNSRSINKQFGQLAITHAHSMYEKMKIFRGGLIISNSHRICTTTQSI